MKYSDLDLILIQSKPKKYLLKYFVTIDDLFDNYTFLSNISYDGFNRDRLVQLVCNYILLKKRNKKELSKRVLYKILKNSEDRISDTVIIDMVFFVYKKYILKNGEDVWHLSYYLKDVPLSDEQIDWLLENCNSNEYVLNRLLRYPLKNFKIAEWAFELLKNSDIYPERISEYLALAIIKNNLFEHYYNDTNIHTSDLAWVIFYTILEDKEKYLEKLLSRDSNCVQISSVALRLGFNSIIEKQWEIQNKTL